MSSAPNQVSPSFKLHATHFFIYRTSPAHIDATNELGESPLFLAIFKSNFEAAQMLIDCHVTEIFWQIFLLTSSLLGKREQDESDVRNSHLSCCVFRRYKNIRSPDPSWSQYQCKRAKGLDSNTWSYLLCEFMTSSSSHFTELFLQQGNTHALQLLLKRGGDVNAQDCFGVSPIFTAAASGRNECLQTLINAGDVTTSHVKTRLSSWCHQVVT